MNCHFMDNINLPNSHPSVLGHCYPFLVKNRVFGLLDRIAPPLKIQNSIVETHFSFFKIFHIFKKIQKNLH